MYARKKKYRWPTHTLATINEWNFVPDATYRWRTFTFSHFLSRIFNSKWIRCGNKCWYEREKKSHFSNWDSWIDLCVENWWILLIILWYGDFAIGRLTWWIRWTVWCTKWKYVMNFNVDIRLLSLVSWWHGAGLFRIEYFNVRVLLHTIPWWFRFGGHSCRCSLPRLGGGRWCGRCGCRWQWRTIGPINWNKVTLVHDCKFLAVDFCLCICVFMKLERKQTKNGKIATQKCGGQSERKNKFHFFFAYVCGKTPENWWQPFVSVGFEKRWMKKIVTWSIACLLEIEFLTAKLTDPIVAEREYFLSHFVHLIIQHRRIKWPKALRCKKANNIWQNKMKTTKTKTNVLLNY